MKKKILSVEFNDDTNSYDVSSDEGVSVPELAFSVTVLIKVLIRDKYIKNKKEFDRLVLKYYKDEQFAELSLEEEVPEDGKYGPS